MIKGVRGVGGSFRIVNNHRTTKVSEKIKIKVLKKGLIYILVE